MNDTPALAESRPTTLQYLPGLDGLRALSVLAVIAFHQYFVYGTERGWMPGGFLGVEVFFVVSGYLITSLLLAERRESGVVSLKRFWARRARRLLPALWALLAVVVAYALLVLPDSIRTLKGDALAAFAYMSNWWQILAHRSYAETSGRPELLKHLWSLAIEEQFYLFWPPLLMLGLRKLGRSRMIVAMVAVALGSTIAIGVVSFASINFAYYSTFTRLSGLLLGSVWAFYFAPYMIRGMPARGARLALDAVGILGLFVLFLAFSHYTFPITGSAHMDRSVFVGGFFVVDLATLLVITAAVHPSSDVGRLLGIPLLQWIGKRSYSLYLWHFPIFAITRPRVDFQNLGHLHGWPVLVLRLFLSFLAAELSFRFVETPIRSGALSRYRERLRAEEGVRRQRLVRRGALLGGTCILMAVVLSAGLAAAQPQADHFDGPQNGAAADPSAIAALRGTVATTSPTSAAGTTTTTTVPAIPRVLAIGDSVMLGSKGALTATIPGIGVDAITSRQFGEAVAIVGFYLQENLLPPVIVVHLGTNGRVTAPALDQIMSLAGSKRTVYFLTARVPRVWESEVNDTLHAAAARFKNLKVLEWRDFAGCHDDWFVDGFHLRQAGQAAYAQFILDGIQGHPKTQCVK